MTPSAIMLSSALGIRPERRARACRHCQGHNVTRPRGLCWACFYTPSIRALYPEGSADASTTKFAYRSSVGLGYARRPIPDEPTTASPGSPEKLAVLVKRAESGVGLWHPADAKY